MSDFHWQRHVGDVIMNLSSSLENARACKHTARFASVDILQALNTLLTQLCMTAFAEVAF